MTNDSTERGQIPVDRWPDPVCWYQDDNGSVVIESANSQFRTTFGMESCTSEQLSDVFDELGLTVVSEPAGVDMTEPTDEQLLVRADEQASSIQYLVRKVPDGDSNEGLLVFTTISREETPQDTAGEIGLDHVASVVSHDLRNPLDVAKARLRAARETGEDGHFDHVAQAHGRMERIIEDVLTLARGADVVEPDEQVALEAVAETAWDSVETDQSTLVLDRPLPNVMADPDRLSRLFENLFRNALEHGQSATHPPATQNTTTGEEDSQGITIVVGELETSDGFFVADDGRGIPRNLLERIFEPGYSTDKHGTGLGLSIVARIVDLHGWSITATTSSSGGARFDITDVDTV